MLSTTMNQFIDLLASRWSLRAGQENSGSEAIAYSSVAPIKDAKARGDVIVASSY